MLRDLGSPLAVLAAWAPGGLLALAGALSYAELTAAFPQNRGNYALRGRMVHPALGFAAGVILRRGLRRPVAAKQHLRLRWG